VQAEAAASRKHEREVDAMYESDAPRKPTKDDPYVALFGELWVTEQTPNGHSFRLSPNVFSEVNREMEDAMFLSAVRMLGLRIKDDPRKAFVAGRDCNSVVSTFAEFYDEISAASSCPLVVRDAELNRIRCRYVRKNELGKIIREYFVPTVEDSTRRICDHHVLITAGRHGLHPSTSKELVALAAEKHLHEVLYVSCNVVSMIRDLYILHQQFVIQDAATFDFFPGTKYTMTMLHLHRPRSGSIIRRLLVLPSGAPGAGKTSCGEFIEKSFQTSLSTRLTRCKSHRKNESLVSIPRQLDPFVLPNITVSVFHRDKVFAEAKCDGCSFKQTTAATHARFQECLREFPAPSHAYQIVYIDATNTSPEAQKCYVRTFCEVAPSLSNVALVLPFVFVGPDGSRLPDDRFVEESERRVQQRTSHPTFPTAISDQRNKIRGILSSAGAMQPHANTRPEELVGGDTQVIVQHLLTHAGDDAQLAHLQTDALLTSFAFLICSAQVALQIREQWQT
jgi:hypothetical protein